MVLGDFVIYFEMYQIFCNISKIVLKVINRIFEYSTCEIKLCD